MTETSASGHVHGIDYLVRFGGESLRYILMDAEIKLAVATEKALAMPSKAYLEMRIGEYLDHAALEWT